MPTGLPCPNPTCKHLFSLEAIQGLETISCPNCKKVFSMRFADKSGTKPSTANVSENKHPSATKPIVPAIKVTSGIKPSSTAVKKILSKTKKSSGLTMGQVILLGFSVFFIAASCAAFYIIGMPLLKGHIAVDKENQLIENNSAIDATFFNLNPVGSYTKDQKLALLFKTQFAYTGSNKDIWLFYYKDFKTRLPTDSEINHEMLSRLKLFLNKNLEYEEVPDGAMIGKVAFKKFAIEGSQEDSSLWSGECYSTSVNGVLFLIMCVAPADNKNQVVGNWEQFNQRLTIKSAAKIDWKPTPRKTKLVVVDKVKMQFKAPDAVWISQDTKDYDSSPESVFIGKNSSEVGDFGNQKAKLYVFSFLKSNKEEKEWAKPDEKLFELLKEEKDAETKIEKIADSKHNSEKPLDKSILSKTEKFIMKNGDQVLKIIFLGTYSNSNGGLVFVCEIPFKTKDYWLDEMNDILKTIASGE